MKNANNMNEKDRLRKKQRRLIVFTLVMLVLWGGLIWLLISFLPSGGDTAKPVLYEDLNAYITDEWPGYTFVSYDEASGVAVIRGQSAVSYEQAEKYGADAYEDLMDSYITTAKALCAGLRLDCGLEKPSVRLEQMSTDGQVILSVTDGGDTTACWRQENK